MHTGPFLLPEAAALMLRAWQTGPPLSFSGRPCESTDRALLRPLGCLGEARSPREAAPALLCSKAGSGPAPEDPTLATVHREN